MSKSKELEAQNWWAVIDATVDKAYPIFKLFGWQWNDKDVTRREIKDTLIDLCNDLLEGGDLYRTSTGRFTVCLEKNSYSKDYKLEIYLDLGTIKVEAKK